MTTPDLSTREGRDQLRALADAAEVRADRAEAALQRVRDVLDGSTLGYMASGVPLGLVVKVPDVRRALNDGDPTTPCGRGPCALGDGHTGNCRM